MKYSDFTKAAAILAANPPRFAMDAGREAALYALDALLGEAAGGGLRYFLLVVWSGGIYPMLFPLLNKLDRRKIAA